MCYPRVGLIGRNFSVCKTESLFWEFDSCLSCLSVLIPYMLELILVRSDDRYIRSIQIIFIPHNRPYILKHTISPGNIYRTNVPYHIPSHISFPPHRAIIPYHRHTISHTVPHHTQCHTVPYHIPYQTYNIIQSIPYPTKNTHTNLKTKNPH